MGAAVSADLKGSQVSRFRGEPKSLPVVAEHTNETANRRKAVISRDCEFVPSPNDSVQDCCSRAIHSCPYCGIPVVSIFVSTD